MKRVLSLLLAIVFSLGLCVSASADGEAPDWTVFVYLCGSDLESDSGLASEDLWEMIAAPTKGVRFVVETGGAREWSSRVSADALERYEVGDGKYTLVESLPRASMGESVTLAEFLHWGLERYPAERYGLILWNHGSGSINGVCFDESFGDDSLYLNELDAALYSAYARLGKPFDFIGFDACLMATVETAAVSARYARYMIASQETEPGCGWDYVGIGDYLAAHPGADAEELGRAICDLYYRGCVKWEDEQDATLSLIDLSRIDALRAAFDLYAGDLYRLAQEEGAYAPVARAVAGADNFGGNNRSEGYTNMVDLAGVIEAGADMSEYAEAALHALEDAVLYEVHGPLHTRASGLSVYYPLRVEGSMELRLFREVCVSAYYLGLVDAIASAGSGLGASSSASLGSNGNSDGINSLNGLFGQGSGSGNNTEPSSETSVEIVNPVGSDSDADGSNGVGVVYPPAASAEPLWPAGVESTVVDFAVPPGLDEDGVYSFTLSETGLNGTASVQAVVYLLSEDGEDAIGLGYTSDVLADWESGLFQDNFDGYWFGLPDGQFLCVYLVEEGDGYDYFTSPILLNGERTNLRFLWDYRSDRVYILDVWDGVGISGAAARSGRDLQPGDVLLPLYDAFSLESGVKFSYFGEEYIYDGDDSLSFEWLPDGDYLYRFCINDIYGDFLLTDTVEFCVEEGEIYFYPEAIDADAA